MIPKNFILLFHQVYPENETIIHVEKICAGTMFQTQHPRTGGKIPQIRSLSTLPARIPSRTSFQLPSREPIIPTPAPPPSLLPSPPPPIPPPSLSPQMSRPPPPPFPCLLYSRSSSLLRVPGLEKQLLWEIRPGSGTWARWEKGRQAGRDWERGVLLEDRGHAGFGEK